MSTVSTKQTAKFSSDTISSDSCQIQIKNKPMDDCYSPRLGRLPYKTCSIKMFL